MARAGEDFSSSIYKVGREGIRMRFGFLLSWTVRDPVLSLQMFAEGRLSSVHRVGGDLRATGQFTPKPFLLRLPRAWTFIFKDLFFWL